MALAREDKTARKLYQQFIEEASKLYVDSLMHDQVPIPSLVSPYAAMNKMKVVSTPRVAEGADKIIRMIIDAYFLPNKTLPRAARDDGERRAGPILPFFGPDRRLFFGRRKLYLLFRIKPAGSYRYLQIVHSVRKGQKVRQQVIATLGRLDLLVASEQLERLMRSGLRHCQKARARTINSAITLLYWQVVQRIGRLHEQPAEYGGRLLRRCRNK